jgi:ribosomal-protein-alanine N-acetyltransferase
MQFKDIKEIQTKRFMLRVLNTNDVDITYAIRSNKIVRQYIAKPLFTKQEEAEKHMQKVMNSLVENEAIGWVICDKKETVKLGEICLWNFSEDKKTAEVGYNLLPEYFRKGIMTEALKVVLDFGFNELQLNTIEAYTSKRNHGSIALLEKYNFKLQKNRIDKDNSDNNIYSLST